MSGKLTKAQREFLELLAEHSCSADPSYRPAMKLAELGYATRERQAQGMRLYIFTITEVGRASLSKDHVPDAGKLVSGSKERGEHG